MFNEYLLFASTLTVSGNKTQQKELWPSADRMAPGDRAGREPRSPGFSLGCLPLAKPSPKQGSLHLRPSLGWEVQEGLERQMEIVLHNPLLTHEGPFLHFSRH